MFETAAWVVHDSKIIIIIIIQNKNNNKMRSAPHVTAALWSYGFERACTDRDNTTITTYTLYIMHTHTHTHIHYKSNKSLHAIVRFDQKDRLRWFRTKVRWIAIVIFVCARFVILAKYYARFWPGRTYTCAELFFPTNSALVRTGTFFFSSL